MQAQCYCYHHQCHHQHCRPQHCRLQHCRPQHCDLNIAGLNIAGVNMTISSFVNSTGDCCFSAQCCFSGLCFSGCLLDCARFAGSVSLDYICLIHSWLIDILPGNCSICFLDLPVQDCCCTLPCSALPSHSEDALHWLKFTQIRCLEQWKIEHRTIVLGLCRTERETGFLLD